MVETEKKKESESCEKQQDKQAEVIHKKKRAETFLSPQSNPIQSTIQSKKQKRKRTRGSDRSRREGNASVSRLGRVEMQQLFAVGTVETVALHALHRGNVVSTLRATRCCSCCCRHYSTL